MLPLHTVRSSSSHSTLFLSFFPPFGVIDVSAFSRLAAGVQTYSFPQRGSVVQRLTRHCVGQSKDTVADIGVFYFPGHMSSLFTTGLTLVDAGLGGQEPHHYHLTNCTPQHYPCHMVGHSLVATVSMRRSSRQPQSFNLTSLPLSTTPAIRATKDASDQTARP